MANENSNKKDRNRSIRKALVFTVFPMLLMGLAVYLLIGASGGGGTLCCEELEDLKKERETFLAVLEEVTNDWKAYSIEHDSYIKDKYEGSQAEQKNIIEKKGQTLLNKLSDGIRELNEIKYVGILDSLDLRIKEYIADMEGFIEYKEKYPPKEYEDELPDYCQQMLNLCEMQKSDGENKLMKCKEDLKLSGKKHRKELKDAMRVLGINNRVMGRILENVSFGLD